MGEFWIRAVAAAAIAYFCGCFNGAVIVSKYILRDDVRTHGSGNAGLTNFYRTFGGPLTFGVILTDVLKAIVALVAWGGFLILVLLTRYVSLGSSSTGVTVPISTWLVYHDGILLLLSIIIGGLILWKHRGNIQRLLAGTESKFYFHKKVK